MNTPGGTQALVLGKEPDPYLKVVSQLQKNPVPRISIPRLSKLLGVKSTTLNARFRREQTSLKTVGRTSFIPLELALHLAALHKYALLGWPTLQQASRLTGVKSGTLKARCEKGRMEGYPDLTKRLRISPAELSHLRESDGRRHSVPRFEKAPARKSMIEPIRLDRPRSSTIVPAMRQTEQPLAVRDSPERIVLNRAASDSRALLQAQPQRQQTPTCDKQQTATPKRKLLGCLIYDPDRPFAVSECAAGQLIKYGRYEGKILKVIDDPFSPRILAKFPEHEHPLMREVQLIVEKNAGS